MADAWAAVLEGISPRIRPQQLDVRTPPFLFVARRRIHQNLQSFLCCRITIEIDIKSCQRVFELSDIGLGSADFRIVSRADELRKDGGCQNAENDHHDHDLDQREPGRTVLARLCFHLFPVFHLPQWIARLILKMGSNMAITMNPTSAPTTRIIAGATSETKVFVRARIWRSSMSATLSNISSSVPVSSPTAIIWITVFGKTPSLRKGAARESPPRVSSATREISCASTRFPMVFSTIFSAGNRDTPLFTSVPRVRAKRLKAAARKTEPITGRRSFIRSHTSAPRGERTYQRTPASRAACPGTIQGQ